MPPGFRCDTRPWGDSEARPGPPPPAGAFLPSPGQECFPSAPPLRSCPRSRPPHGERTDPHDAAPPPDRVVGPAPPSRHPLVTPARGARRGPQPDKNWAPAGPIRRSIHFIMQIAVIALNTEGHDAQRGALSASHSKAFSVFTDLARDPVATEQHGQTRTGSPRGATPPSARPLLLGLPPGQTRTDLGRHAQWGRGQPKSNSLGHRVPPPPHRGFGLSPRTRTTSKYR